MCQRGRQRERESSEGDDFRWERRVQQTITNALEYVRKVYERISLSNTGQLASVVGHNMNLHFVDGGHNLKSNEVSRLARSAQQLWRDRSVTQSIDRLIVSTMKLLKTRTTHNYTHTLREREIIQKKSAALFYIEWVARNLSLWMNTRRLTYIAIWYYTI